VACRTRPIPAHDRWLGAKISPAPTLSSSRSTGRTKYYCLCSVTSPAAPLGPVLSSRVSDSHNLTRELHNVRTCVVSRSRLPPSLSVGALDGVQFSNTWALEKCFGWHGVLIEADPTNFQKLTKADRPKATRIHAAVCDKFTHAIPITRWKDHGWGSGNFNEFTEAHKGRFNFRDNGIVTFVPCQPLQALMKVGGHPTADFLSLDVEGSELSVIQNANVSAFSVIMIEADGDNPHKEKRVHDLLLERGFWLAYVMRLANPKEGGLNHVYLQKALEAPVLISPGQPVPSPGPSLCFDHRSSSPQELGSGGKRLSASAFGAMAPSANGAGSSGQGVQKLPTPALHPRPRRIHGKWQ